MYKVNSGIIKFIFKTINDRGGYTVIGVSNGTSIDSYTNSIGQAGDTYTGGDKWDKSISWSENNEIEMTVDSVKSTLTLYNKTKNETAIFTFEKSIFDTDL